MKGQMLYMALGGCLLASPAFSGEMQEMGSYSSGRKLLIQANFGPSWSKAGVQQTFHLTSDIEKTYTVSRNNTVMLNGGLFVGVQRALTSQLLGQIGFSLAATGNARVSGDIWDDAEPQFDNYIYRYKVQNTRLGIKGGLVLDKGYRLMPYVNGSVNVGFNRAFGFFNMPVILEAVANNSFGNKVKTAFTYTLGAGLQKKINQYWQIGLGYEFMDFGKSHLNRALDQTVNSGLALNHIYSHGALFNITYVS